MAACPMVIMIAPMITALREPMCLSAIIPP